MRSLRTRLLVASLAVALMAVVVTAWAVNRATSSQVRDAVANDLQSEEWIYEELSFFAFASGSWDGVEAVVAELADVFDERVALTTVDGAMIADSDPGAVLPSTPDRFIDPTSPVISFDEPPGVIGFGYDDYSEHFDDLMIALEEAGVPFHIDQGFGLDFPVWDPEDPLAGPVVGQFLIDEYLEGEAVSGSGLILDDAAMAALLEDGGVPFEETVGPDGEITIVWDETQPLVIEALPWGSQVGVVSGGLPFLGDSADPALLFLGVGTEATVLPDPIGWRLLLIVALVAAAATLATVVVSRRVLGPIGALTSATRKMEQGDLGERVPVSGSDEIATLAGAFNAMADSLAEQDRLRKTMTSDIAHELRTPLSNIRGYLEALEEGVVEPTPEMIGSLREEAVHLQGLIDELQDLALAESGELRIDLQTIDLAEHLQRVVTAHSAAAEANGAEILLEAEAGVEVSADAGRLRQLLGNLLRNAVQHTAEGGTVTVRLVPGEEAVEVQVVDDGEGISPEHLPHVFDRFYRADSSRSRATGGSGLGLAIAAELARLHGGTLTAASEPGRGSVFTLRLPR